MMTDMYVGPYIYVSQRHPVHSEICKTVIIPSCITCGGILPRLKFSDINYSISTTFDLISFMRDLPSSYIIEIFKLRGEGAKPPGVRTIVCLWLT